MNTMTALADIQGLLRSAISEHRCVEMVYYTAGRDATSHRVVEPISLDSAGYMAAYCRWRGEVRTFATWRIRWATLLHETFEPHSYVAPLSNPPRTQDYQPWERQGYPPYNSGHATRASRQGCLLPAVLALAVALILMVRFA